MDNSTVGESAQPKNKPSVLTDQQHIAKLLLERFYLIHEKSKGNLPVDVLHQISEMMEGLLQLCEQFDSFKFTRKREVVPWPASILSCQQLLVLGKSAVVPQPSSVDIRKSPCLGPYRERVGHLEGVYFGQYANDNLHGWGAMVDRVQPDLGQWFVSHG